MTEKITTDTVDNKERQFLEYLEREGIEWASIKEVIMPKGRKRIVREIQRSRN